MSNFDQYYSKSEPFGADHKGVLWTEHRLYTGPEDTDPTISLDRRDGLSVSTAGSPDGVFWSGTRPGGVRISIDESMAGTRDRIKASTYIDEKYPLEE